MKYMQNLLYATYIFNSTPKYGIEWLGMPKINEIRQEIFLLAAICAIIHGEHKFKRSKEAHYHALRRQVQTFMDSILHKYYIYNKNNSVIIVNETFLLSSSFCKLRQTLTQNMKFYEEFRKIS